MINIKLPPTELLYKEQIPRIIHCCWFSDNTLSPMALTCIESWKKYLPEYKIIMWDKYSFDCEAHPFTNEAYKAKKWAFVSDYVRLFVLNEFGGIYMDLDVEITKPIDIFLRHSSFLSFEAPNLLSAGLMASSKESKWIKKLLSYYDDKHFVGKNGIYDELPNTFTITEITFRNYNLKLNNNYQILEDDIHIYPSDYFSPKSYETGFVNLTENTYCIHHFSGSWKPKHQKFEKYFWTLLGLKNQGVIDRVKNLFRKIIHLISR